MIEIGIREMAQLNSTNCSTETQVQVFSYEFNKIFKNPLFTEHLWRTAFGYFHWLLLPPSEL